MLSKFFLDRPVFAWVIAVFIMLLGGLGILIPKLRTLAGYGLIALMIAGNAAQMPGSLLDSARTLTSVARNGPRIVSSALTSSAPTGSGRRRAARPTGGAGDPTPRSWLDHWLRRAADG